MFAEMSNKELSNIIKAFFKCDNCLNCPCDGTVCVAGAGYAKSRRAEFALEVAERLVK